MPGRNALVIEADRGFASEISSALVPYGFTVEILPDGKEVAQTARPLMPDVVFLCVEPKNVGYAICNKLKKHEAWKQIPIVLMSAEATAETFDQHRKLKTHADAYMRKPFDMDELLGTVGELVTLDEPELRDDQEISLDSADGIEEIMLDDEELAVMEDPPEESFPEETTLLGLDRGVNEADADAALAVLQEVPTEDPLSDLPPPPELFSSRGIEETTPLRTVAAPRPLGAPLPGVRPLPTEEIAVDAPAPAQPSAGSVSSMLAGASMHESEAAGGQVQELQARVAELEQERARLQRTIESAPQAPRPEGQGFSREREFLNLREVINRKEKEILDLKGDLDAKERQGLDFKVRIRDLEHKGRDFEEKLLAFEQQVLAAQEQMEDQRAETDLLKKKVADERAAAERELERSRSEARAAVESAAKEAAAGEREKLVAEHESARARTRTEHESALAALRDEHAGEIAALHQAHEATQTEKAQQHRSAMDHLRREMQEALGSADQLRVRELANAEERRQGELAAADERRTRELAVLIEQHRVELQVLAEQMEGRVRELEREHAGKLAASQQESDAARASLAKAHRSDIAAAQTEHERALETHAKAFDAKMSELKADHAKQMEESQQQSRDLRTGMEQRHQSRIDDLKGKHGAEVASLTHELQQRDQDLAAAHGQMSMLSAELESARGRGEELDRILGELRDQAGKRESLVASQAARLEELERQNTGFQEQVLKAFVKIQNDAKLAEKARKALAIAVALLEEQLTLPPESAAAENISKPENKTA